MSIPGSVNPLFLGAAGQATGGGEYQIERSVRFNSPDSAYLSRTPGTAGNRKTWTWAGWVKASRLGTYRGIFEGYTGSPALANRTSLQLANSDQIDVLFDNTSSGHLKTTQVFRDPSAWYHIVFACDTTQATASNRFKIYINGSQITTFATATYPSQNYDTGINTTQAHYMGRVVDPLYADFYLADIHFIDGQALTPSSFGEYDTNNVWQPIEYTGSYNVGVGAVNGFHLPFSDNSTAAALGTDTSSNGNDWTPNNLSNLTGGPTSVAAAQGALPLYNTTDTYGTVKGTGTRTDSNSSSIVLAVPMDGTNNGTTFTDESATIKGSGIAKTVTAFGNAKTITAESKYYGSSADFAADGTDYLEVPHSSDLNLNSATNWTVEAWVYVDTNRTYNYFVSKGRSTSREWAIATTSTTVRFYWSTNGSGSGDQTVAISHVVPIGKWNHIAVVKSSSTITIYVNGVAIGSGSFTSGYSGTLPLYVGRFADYTGISHSLDGKINDLRIYNGVAKYTSNFNPPSSTQNATVAAGNDSLVDSPTNGSQEDTGVGGEVVGNYCTWNPLAKGSSTTLSNGNLDMSSGASWQSVIGTLGVTSGKWYWEQTMTTNQYSYTGICNQKFFNFNTQWPGQTINSWSYLTSSGLAKNDQAGGSEVSVTLTVMPSGGGTLGFALDLDNQKLWFALNGTWMGSGSPNPATGTAAAFTNLISGDTYFPCADVYTASAVFNFGQRPFAYTAPSGFKALNTANLPTPTIADGSTAMDVVTYTGNGSTQTISGLNFSPDLVWVKQRSSSIDDHILKTSLQTKFLSSNQTVGERGNDNDLITSFDAAGFTVNSTYLGNANNSTNGNGITFAAWTWDAGSSTVTNTQGSITSQVRANASAGFSVVTYTGNSTAGATVGHGLGVKPGMIILKYRSTTSAWWVKHLSINEADQHLQLNSTTGAITSSNNDPFNGSLGTSTTFVVGSTNSARYGNGNGTTISAYCFAPVDGYSSFGRYTGNGSTDGPFVYLGFLPKIILIKRTDTTSNWTILDTLREGYNVDNDPLFPNLSNAEGTTDLLDINSNGFKLRTTDASVNVNTGTYVYAAWASNPFQYSRAR
jgi:hypothetical protein